MRRIQRQRARGDSCAPTPRAAAPRPPEESPRRDDVVLAPLNDVVPASTPRVTAHPELLDDCGETGRVGPSGLLPHLRRMRTQARTRRAASSNEPYVLCGVLNRA
jgi:hypothetical protein